MAAMLAHLQSLKSSCDHLVVAIEDVNDLWPIVREGFEARVPFRRACLTSKARNPVTLDKLPVEYILTTDSRLRNRIPHEQTAFWFHEPYATVVLVTCEDLDEYKTILKPRLKLITQNEEQEWFIVFVSKAQLANDQGGKLIRKVYGKLEVDFSSKRRERCCKLDMHIADAAFWEDVESKIVECIRVTLERRMQFYEDEIRNLTENRFSRTWSFCNFFILKESLAFMFQMAQLEEDALREYDELEQCYLESVSISTTKQRRFGGQDAGDDSSALLDQSRKPLGQVIEDDTFWEFDFRQYIFACQANVLFKLGRLIDVAARGLSFIISFSKILLEHEKNIPFCLREVWAVTACMSLVRETGKQFNADLFTVEGQKEFYRLQADLYALARIKAMRLGDLIGYGKCIERSPYNSASLSMLSWPKPIVWPAIPTNADDVIAEKAKIAPEKPKPFGILRKALPLAPSSLLRDANRRRAALSVGNMGEIFDSRLSNKMSPAGDSIAPLMSPSTPVTTTPHRSVSFGNLNSGNATSPGAGHVDRPMRLPEIYAAAEAAIQSTITDEKLKDVLSSVEKFEDFYIELTKAAADNYHRSWRKRHGVVLDREIADFHYRCSNYDSAVKLYEKVCAMYAGDGWRALLAEVLPSLADCQKQLQDLPGYLLSCIKLLSLERNLLQEEERHTIQSEVLKLAHTALKSPVSLDVSSLITFSGKDGSPLKLCEGDPGNLSISVWSGFPGEITLDALSVTLIATFTPEEGVKVVRSSHGPCLKPGKNTVLMILPPQRPGSYVLGVLTGQLGQVRLRSHTYYMTSALSSKGGYPESDDFLSLERPLRPVLQVAEPRPLLEITSVVSWGLLMNELQWLGLIIRPIDYSLKGSVLNIVSGADLHIEDPQLCELEMAESLLKGSTQKHQSRETSHTGKDSQVLELKAGRVSLPDWASEQSSVLWLRVKAVQEKSNGIVSSPPLSSSAIKSLGSRSINAIVADDGLSNEYTSSVQETKKYKTNVLKDSQTVGVRKLDLKLEFGASHNRLYEKTLTVQYLEPLRILSRVVPKGNGATLLLQVTLISQLNATIIIEDAQLQLQPGFAHLDGLNNGSFPSGILPLVMAPSTESALLFTVCVQASGKENGTTEGQLNKESILDIKYSILGDRTIGAHSPSTCFETDRDSGKDIGLHFRSSVALQMPNLEPLLAVGMLPLPCNNPCVGDQILIQWRIERIKEGICTAVKRSTANCEEDGEELSYEVEVDPDHWMIAGRKKGFFSIPRNAGSRALISLTCIPLVAGYVRPPIVGLPSADKTRISNAPGPQSICVLPPCLCSSFCIKK